MNFKNILIHTKKKISTEVESKSHELALRAGLINQLGSGLYSFLPLGQMVLRNIEAVISEEMNHLGAMETSFPIVQPAELWEKSGRLDTYGSEMLKFSNRDGRHFCFGPTHEEVVSQVASEIIYSYKQMPFSLWQVGKKFRDEKRPRYGLLRCKEFLMKDAYSFDIDQASMYHSYDQFKAAYHRIFSKLALRYVTVNADPGEIGGSGSEEFLAYSEHGEDKFHISQDGNAIKPEMILEEMIENTYHTGIEIGHIFQLGQTYSKKMKVDFLDANGKRQNPFMGCYGIGISRLIATIIEQNHDNDGIIWPKIVTPFDVIIIPLQNGKQIKEKAYQIDHELTALGIKVIVDDRECSAGVKFKDASLIGIPLKLIISDNLLNHDSIEFEIRRTGEKITAKIEDTIATFQNLYENIA